MKHFTLLLALTALAGCTTVPQSPGPGRHKVCHTQEQYNYAPLCPAYSECQKMFATTVTYCHYVADKP
jgi:hypothetical protein